VIAWALDHRLESPMPAAILVKDLELPLEGHSLQARWIMHRPDHDFHSEPTLVFLHEGLGSIAQWRDFPETLARRTNLPALIYDRLGHGGSPALTQPRTMAYLEAEAFQTLPQVLAAAGIAAPALVGHSDGGTIALLYAARFPKKVRAVLSEAAHVFLEPITIQGLCAARTAYMDETLRTKLERIHGDKVDSLFHGWNDTWLDQASRDWDITASLATLQCPLLLIQGEDDAYGSPAQIQAVVSRVQGPVESLLIPSCGHSPHSQARELVLAHMATFLRKFSVSA